MKKTDNIFIVYRNNDLFEREIPKVVNILSSMGNQIETYGFSRGTEHEGIERWYKKNKKLLANKTIISDKTASPFEFNLKSFRLEKILSSSSTKIIKDSLDNIFSDAIEKAIFKDEYKNLNIEKTRDYTSRGSEKKSERWFTSIFRKILSVPENKPEGIFIFTDRIMDHSHAFDHDNYMSLCDGYRQKNQEYMIGSVRDQFEKDVSEKFKGWLTIGGLEPDKIEIVQVRISSSDGRGMNYFIPGGEKVVRKRDKLGYWIIVDRHADNIVGEIKNAKCLQLPESNFYKDARNYGLLKYTDEELYKSLEDVLKKVMKESKKQS